MELYYEETSGYGRFTRQSALYARPTYSTKRHITRRNMKGTRLLWDTHGLLSYQTEIKIQKFVFTCAKGGYCRLGFCSALRIQIKERCE